MSWLLGVGLFFGGAFVGAVLVALVSANGRD